MKKMKYGDGRMGFNDLKYKGKSIDFDKVDNRVETLYFRHLYRTAGFTTGAKKTHACLLHGYWCWKNALERPGDVLRFIKGKLGI